MTQIKFQNIDFTLLSDCKYYSLYVNNEFKIAVCVAEEEYIPIDSFKDIFNTISKHVVEFGLRYFVFDKSKLRSFHQPSMEWYFAVWKPEMKKQGLTNHYKILPNLDWFEKAVEAGKYEIFKKFSKEVMNGIQITYVNSVDQAIEEILVKNKLLINN